MKTSYHLRIVSLELTVNSAIIYFKSEIFSYLVIKYFHVFNNCRFRGVNEIYIDFCNSIW